MSDPEIPLIDLDFDGDDAEDAVISSIRRCGRIEVGPDGWGTHDRFFDTGGDWKPHPTIPVEVLKQRAVDRANERKTQKRLTAKYKRRLSKILRFRDGVRRNDKHWDTLNGMLLYQPGDKDLVQSILESFPHATQFIANEVTKEFVAFGSDDARKRSIAPIEWVWRRSRFLAGHK